MNADDRIGQDPPSRLRQSEDSEEDVTGSRLQHEDERGGEPPQRLQGKDDDDENEVEGNRLV